MRSCANSVASQLRSTVATTSDCDCFNQPKERVPGAARPEVPEKNGCQRHWRSHRPQRVALARTTAKIRHEKERKKSVHVKRAKRLHINLPDMSGALVWNYGYGRCTEAHAAHTKIKHCGPPARGGNMK